MIGVAHRPACKLVNSQRGVGYIAIVEALPGDIAYVLGILQGKGGVCAPADEDSKFQRTA